MSKFQALLCCVILTLSLTALAQNRNAHATVQSSNPADDPRFADLVQTGYSPPNYIEMLTAQAANQEIQTAHQAEYSAALGAYQRETEAAREKAAESAKMRDALIGWTVVTFLLLALTWLPWGRWRDKANKSANVAAEGAGKLAARGYFAAKALAEPSPIVRRSGLETYSVADELSKWSKLRDEGVVTQEEFEAARTTLLRREP